MLAYEIQHLDIRVLDVHVGIGLHLAVGSQLFGRDHGSGLRKGGCKRRRLPRLDTANVLDAHEFIPSVVVRTNTVAGRGEVASLSPEGRDQ